MTRTRLLAGLALLLAAVPIGLSTWASPAWLTEHYSRGFYPVVQRTLAPLSGAVPISITGLGLLGAVPLLLGLAVRGYRRGRRAGRTHNALLLRGAVRAVGGAVLLYATFLTTWGLGYRQVPVESRWGLGPEDVGPEDVHAFARRIAAIVAEVPSRHSRDPDVALAAIRAALADLVQAREGWTPRLAAHVKELPDGMLLAFGVTGIASPLLLEAHVDGGLPEVHRIAVAAHELAHVVGYCGEADADLAGYTAALQSGDRYARFAVALRIFRALAADLPPEQWLALHERLPAAVHAELERSRRTVAARRWQLGSAVTGVVYDRYLRSQGVASGRRDYGRSTRLLVRAWRSGLLELPPP